ncbi:hypothetical protein AC579_519 [Pseudocercospora musae]|uniref:Alpha/beta hydrolase fold-3 domain-containing protein n=1 Tax=Pseudocercospora musae TaxID=113226 RepID=A0A139IRQ7_9PEZI|nr:hypothetical protein AC579_519 [Pseudocercospora musae]
MLSATCAVYTSLKRQRLQFLARRPLCMSTADTGFTPLSRVIIWSVGHNWYAAASDQMLLNQLAAPELWFRKDLQWRNTGTLLSLIHNGETCEVLGLGSGHHLPIKPQDSLTIDELFDVQIDGEPIPLRRYRQTSLPEHSPLLLHMHGGGFVTGSLETDDYMCREIALGAPVVVVSIAYRLAPEHPFPTGFNDCLQVIRWAFPFEGQRVLGVDLRRGFLLGGESAGGNFTAGHAHAMLEQDRKPQLSGLLFKASSFCHPDVRPEQYRDRIASVDEVDDAPGLTVKSIKFFADKYGTPYDDRRYSPLLHPSRKGLAKKAFFQTCGWDSRRDEAILYRKFLQEEGIETREKIYKGLPHGFWTTCPDLPESKAAIQDTVDGVKWMLE